MGFGTGAGDVFGWLVVPAGRFCGAGAGAIPIAVPPCTRTVICPATAWVFTFCVALCTAANVAMIVAVPGVDAVRNPPGFTVIFELFDDQVT
jgi:hypothetical protein